jgi:hypothetical protein
MIDRKESRKGPKKKLRRGCFFEYLVRTRNFATSPRLVAVLTAAPAFVPWCNHVKRAPGTSLRSCSHIHVSLQVHANHSPSFPPNFPVADYTESTGRHLFPLSSAFPNPSAGFVGGKYDRLASGRVGDTCSHEK